MELRNPSNGEILNDPPIPKNAEDIDSSCSTPYVSAPSSPGRTFPSTAAASGYFFSAPASPVHYVLYSAPSGAATSVSTSPDRLHPSAGSFEFGGAGLAGPMIPADEIFLNCQIRPQPLAPLIDQDDEVGVEEEEARGARLRSRSIHRRARSMSPLRNRYEGEDEEEAAIESESKADPDLDPKQQEDPVAPSSSAKRSSSKRWVFLKDLLYRSKSEGRGRDQKEKGKRTGARNSAAAPQNGVSERRRRRGGVPPQPSAHERHYAANRAQAEEMRRRTFLPYREGLLGCLGFSSRDFGAVDGLARTLSPVPSM